ncbi:hypothetical protein ACH5RR_031168 [Cinchona calisaya]|uniref:NAD(P)-binding Rossmann-fold superfamily protein n=1 Tax=Cinchona calisaya TaxID=153742 RepID=A0ABD2YFR1_9GENT
MGWMVGPASNSCFSKNASVSVAVLRRFQAPKQDHHQHSSVSFLSVSTKFPHFTQRISHFSSFPISMASLGAPSETLETLSLGVVGANDLMIVGPGVLGRLVAEKWREEHPGCQIVGQTVTSDHHAELIEMGIKPLVKETKLTHKFPYVIFCAPPSRTSDYPGDVREAASNWSGEGSFLFTSSSAPYDCNDNGSCDENSPVVPFGRSPRTDVLLNTEKVVLEAGGCVLRLAGLYISLLICDLSVLNIFGNWILLVYIMIPYNKSKYLDCQYKVDRGAHMYWLKKGTCDIRPDHILNLIHYEDAASLSVVILKKKLQGRIFLGCDNHPLCRQEVMDLVERSGKFSQKFEGFTGTDDPLGKKLNNSKTRSELGWEPKYPSFAQFLGVS